MTPRYFGFGLSYFGLIPGRDDDSCGFGLAYGVMTKDPNAGLVFFANDNLRSTEPWSQRDHFDLVLPVENP